MRVRPPPSFRSLVLFLAVAALVRAEPGPVSAALAEAAEVPRFDYLYGDRELYPSALVSFTEDSRFAPRDDTQFGDPQGVISVLVRAPTDHCRVVVRFEENAFVEESRCTAILPKAGEYYRIAPIVRYRLEKLAALKQPLANLVLHAVVLIGDVTHELSAKLVVHSVNDAVLRYLARPRPDDDEVLWNYEVRYVLAAYVNENNPWIDQVITRHALNRRYVDAFSGYQRDEKYVESVVEAVHKTLVDFGFRYTDFPQGSAAPVGRRARVRIQAIRLVGDTLESAQANAVETALIFASVLRKMSIHTVVYLLPDKQSLLGVYLDRSQDADSLLVLDPRQLVEKDGSFAQAKKSGTALFAKAKPYLVFPEGKTEAILLQRTQAQNLGYLTINIGDARENGILPIPEVRREYVAPRTTPTVSP